MGNWELEERLQMLEAELAELKISRAKKALRVLRRNRRTLIAGIIMGLTIPVAISALSITKPHTFTAGNPTVAAEVNANFDALFTKANDLAAYHPPIGSIIAWHKNMPSSSSTPALPAEWVECNGQTLGPIGSIYDGQTIPNLNGNLTGADSPGQSSKVAMFLRGGAASGTGQQDAFQGHYHNPYPGEVGFVFDHGAATGADGPGNLSLSWPVRSTTGAPVTDNTHGSPRTDNETRPVNMSVIWIMKVK